MGSATLSAGEHTVRLVMDTDGFNLNFFDATPAVASETLVWSEEFNGGALDTSKWHVVTGTEGNSQSHYTTVDVSVGNGALDLRTRRHCVASASDALTDANASTAACASGLLTEYSSGKVQTDHVLSSGRIEVRAKLPATELGLWPAIWLRNPPGWGSADYGELDTMEWYADDATRDTATSHITCPTANSTVHVQHFLKKTVDLSTDWHVWSMRWSAAGISYSFDGEPLPSSTGDADKSTDTWADFPGVTQAAFEGVLNQLWQIRLNTQVTKPGDAWHAAPDNAQPFAPVDYLIDYIRVYQ